MVGTVADSEKNVVPLSPISGSHVQRPSEHIRLFRVSANEGVIRRITILAGFLFSNLKGNCFSVTLFLCTQMKRLLQGAEVWRDGGFVRADVLVDGDRIAAVGLGLPAEGCEVVPLGGMKILPGWSMCTYTCANPALRPRRPSPRERARLLTAVIRPSVRCPIFRLRPIRRSIWPSSWRRSGATPRCG